MVRPEYLEGGLNALSRAHRANAMAGHLGAAVAAGYLIGERHPDLDGTVAAGIEAELERIIGGESVFSPGPGSPVTVAELFETRTPERPEAELVARIVEALETNIGQTRQSGHNVIFAAIALRALRVRPGLATPTVTGGICQLIGSFGGVGPGSGYYGQQRGRIDGRRVALPAESGEPPYASLAAMAQVVMAELARTAGERRDGFGGLWHVINHAAALAELAACGYPELAVRGLPAHHRHLRLFRSLPDVSDELGPETPAEHDPRTPAFWSTGQIRRDRARLEHRIKTLYAFDVLVDLVEDEALRRAAGRKLLYLM